MKIIQNQVYNEVASKDSINRLKCLHALLIQTGLRPTRALHNIRGQLRRTMRNRGQPQPQSVLTGDKTKEVKVARKVVA